MIDPAMMSQQPPLHLETRLGPNADIRLTALLVVRFDVADSTDRLIGNCDRSVRRLRVKTAKRMRPEFNQTDAPRPGGSRSSRAARPRLTDLSPTKLETQWKNL